MSASVPTVVEAMGLQAAPFGRHAWRILLLGLFLLIYIPVEGEDLPSWEAVETKYGQMKIREFGLPDGPLAVLVHGVTDNDYIRNEWNPVAVGLAASGFHVILPDFHSAPPELRPGSLDGERFRELLSSTFGQRNQMIPSRYRSVARPKAVVFGKSWGAKMAAEGGASDSVVATALVVPAFYETASDLLPRIHGDLAICLVQDDRVVNFERAQSALKAAIGDRTVTWLEGKAGGHRILEEFVQPLVNFAEKARPNFVHFADAGREL